MTTVEGKIALITGASSGIGAATALKLAAAGMKVGVAARRADRLESLKADIEAAGGTALVLEMDVANQDSVKSGVAKLVETFGTIDVLFNNAGVMPASDIEELKTDDWDRMVDINVKGVLYVTAAALPHMIKQHSGHIFNTSSIAGRKVFGPESGLVVYSATKFAVTAFSDGLRMEVGKKHNIRVTCIEPGGVATELQGHTTTPKFRKAMDVHRASVDYLQGEDIANAVLFALQAPGHVDFAEMLIMPTQQA
jgi:NADP-dependent 3-hydroxy acid dehydrogenase YdfG